jgi:hypothetical protein
MAYTFTGDPNIGPEYVDIAVPVTTRSGGVIAPGPEGAITYQPQFYKGVPVATGAVWQGLTATNPIAR